MKKLTLLLVIITAAFTGYAQETTHHYTAYRTELYRKYKWEQEYVKVYARHKQDIPISLTGNTLLINADKSSAFLIYGDSKQMLDNDKLEIVSYDAYEITDNRFCKVEFVLIKSTSDLILGITYLDQKTKIGLHYFIRKNN